MKELKEIIKKSIEKEEIKSTNTLKEVYDVCRKNGYQKGKREFELEMEKALTEKLNKMSTIDEKILKKVSGGVRTSMKRKTAAWICALASASGIISPSAFAQNIETVSVRPSKRLIRWIRSHPWISAGIIAGVTIPPAALLAVTGTVIGKKVYNKKHKPEEQESSDENSNKDSLIEDVASKEEEQEQEKELKDGKEISDLESMSAKYIDIAIVDLKSKAFNELGRSFYNEAKKDLDKLKKDKTYEFMTTGCPSLAKVKELTDSIVKEIKDEGTNIIEIQKAFETGVNNINSTIDDLRKKFYDGTSISSANYSIRIGIENELEKLKQTKIAKLKRERLSSPVRIKTLSASIVNEIKEEADSKVKDAKEKAIKAELEYSVNFREAGKETSQNSVVTDLSFSENVFENKKSFYRRCRDNIKQLSAHSLNNLRSLNTDSLGIKSINSDMLYDNIYNIYVACVNGIRESKNVSEDEQKKYFDEIEETENPVDRLAQLSLRNIIEDMYYFEEILSSCRENEKNLALLENKAENSEFIDILEFIQTFEILRMNVNKYNAILELMLAKMNTKMEETDIKGYNKDEIKNVYTRVHKSVPKNLQ